MIRLLTLPFRLALAAITAAIVLPVTLSAKLLRVSLIATVGATRLAIRSSLISFLLGIGAGWFLAATPQGRQLVESVRDRVSGGRPATGGTAGSGAAAAPVDTAPTAPTPDTGLTPHPDEDGQLPSTDAGTSV